MCVRACVCVCVCVHANWLKRGTAIGVAYCKKVHNMEMDSQSCTRFSGMVGHDANDS